MLELQLLSQSEEFLSQRGFRVFRVQTRSPVQCPACSSEVQLHGIRKHIAGCAPHILSTANELASPEQLYEILKNNYSKTHQIARAAQALAVLKPKPNITVLKLDNKPNTFKPIDQQTFQQIYRQSKRPEYDSEDYEEASRRYRQTTDLFGEVLTTDSMVKGEDEDGLNPKEAIRVLKAIAESQGTDAQLKAELEAGIARSTEAIKTFSQCLTNMSVSKSSAEVEAISNQFTDAHGNAWRSFLPDAVRKRAHENESMTSHVRQKKLNLVNL
jgi:hypothetical protein